MSYTNLIFSRFGSRGTGSCSTCQLLNPWKHCCVCAISFPKTVILLYCHAWIAKNSFLETVILLYCNAWTDGIVWSVFVDCHYCECVPTSSSRLPRHLRFTVLKVNSSADPHNFLRSPLRIAILFSWILSLDFILRFLDQYVFINKLAISHPFPHREVSPFQ